MYRLGHCVGGKWIEHSQARVFDVTDRVLAGVPRSDPAIFAALVQCIEPPLFLLYVLHTPRGEAEAGRYQSPELSLAEVVGFLNQFESFLSGDGRYDLWAHSPSDNGTVVWDRHNQLFGYGPLPLYTEKLKSMGFRSGCPEIPSPHEHYYRPELDGLAKELLTEFDWTYSPLRPEDEQ